MSGVHQRMIV